MKPGEVFRPFERFEEILIVPAELARYRGIGAGAKITWGRLARYQSKSGNAFPSIPTLAAELGIGVTQARAYVRELERENFIRIRQRSGTSSTYEFLWHSAFDGEAGEKRKAPPLRKTEGVVVRKTGGVTPSVNRRTPLRKTGDEENHLSESSSKRVIEESHAPAVVPEARGKNPESPSLNNDDDNTKPIPETKWASDRDELIAVIRESTGELPDRKLLRQISDGVEGRGGTLRQYLDDIRPRIGRLKRTPGFGFFHEHARNWGGSEQRQAPEPQPQAPRCSCAFGQIQVDGEWRPCPDCKLGRELAAVTVQIAKERAAKEAEAA